MTATNDLALVATALGAVAFTIVTAFVFVPLIISVL
jgi:hypothetical protein